MAKTFKEGAAAAINPALSFITPTAPTPAAAEQEQQPTAAPRAAETKSRRLQVLIKPSTHAEIKRRADLEGISVNEWINAALEAATKG